MITYENVVTLEKEEIRNITFDNVTYDAVTVAHLQKCQRIAKALTDEVDKHKDIIKAHEVDLKGNKLVSVEHADVPYFSKNDFIAVYGEEEYNRFCTIKDRKTVKF